MEPMDLDSPHLQSYRSNHLTAASTSPPPPASPNRSHLSDMDIDTNSPLPPDPRGAMGGIVSSSSMDCVNQSLSNVLSLQDFNSRDSCLQQTRRDGSPPRTCQSAPPVVSAFFQQITAESKPNSQSRSCGSKRPKTTLGEITGSTNVTTPRSRSKIGYGIRDDENEDGDITFSHYPLSSPSRIGDANNKAGLRSRLTQRSKFNSHDPCVLSCSDAGTLSGLNKNTGGCPTVVKSVLFISCTVLVILFVQTILVSNSCDGPPVFHTKVLEVDLKTDLFGQHIASTLIQKHVGKYFELYHLQNSSSSETHSSKGRHCRPLVLSFHGWTGVGKNFGSRIVSQSFSTVMLHPLVVPLLFPHKHQQEVYANQIEDWIISNVTQCSVNLFIIDEMDKAFPGVQIGLLKAIQTLTSACTSATSPVVFILISNTHATGINQVFVSQSAKSLPSSWDRTDLKEEDFHSIFNDSSRVTHEWYSDLATSGFIDAFIPFLPLEKSHVIDCIKRELVNKQMSTDSDIVSRVLKELSFSQHEGLELSITGCKRVADKVNYVIYNTEI